MRGIRNERAQKRKVRGKWYMTIKQPSGFGILPIIIVIAAVAVLGFVGVRLLTAQLGKSAGTARTPANNSAHPPSLQPSNTQTSSTPAQTDLYLDIKELGIKIKLSDGINDAEYALFQPQQTDGSTIVGISAHSLDDGLSPDAGVHCRADSGAIGAIIATTTDPIAPDEQPQPVDNKTLFKLGDVYYHYVGPQIACDISGPGHEAMAQLIVQKQKAFAEAFKTVQLDK
jgi:hypothetical protein